MYDAIVVGARCAGATTAMLLARKGYRVLLLDKITFPSDTLSTHVIWPPGVACLRRWGLLDKPGAPEWPRMTKLLFDPGGDLTLTGVPSGIQGAAEPLCVRRTVLDRFLTLEAVSAGAELRENFSVEELTTEGQSVTGVRGRQRGGSTVAETARIVIGADGMRSLVARLAQAPEYNGRPSLTCWYYSYWSGVALDGCAEWHVRESRVAGVITTNDGLAVIPVIWKNESFAEYRADIEGNHMRTLEELAPSLAQRARSGRREERWFGTADLPNFFRKPFGPGWALVGDAGYHRDPITAQGISNAFVDAGLLADAIDDGLAGRRPLADALADYRQRRDEAALPMYNFTCQLAALGPDPPEIRRLYQALEGRQEEIDRFLGVIAGTTPIPEYFSPQNQQRIAGGAA